MFVLKNAKQFIVISSDSNPKKSRICAQWSSSSALSGVPEVIFTTTQKIIQEADFPTISEEEF